MSMNWSSIEGCSYNPFLSVAVWRIVLVLVNFLPFRFPKVHAIELRVPRFWTDSR